MWSEPFGIAPLEAMACGCTVITKLKGGHTSFCNKKNTISMENKPHLLDPYMVRKSVEDFNFERIFKLYYPV
jgi:hypothetical protein